MSDIADHVLIKRGLYYRPDSQGYTGIKSQAGLYPKSWENEASGVRAVPFDEAGDYSPACWHETIVADKDKQIAALEARNARLEEQVREAYERAAEAAEGERYAQHYVDASASAGDMRPDIYNEACNDVAEAIRSLKGAAK